MSTVRPPRETDNLNLPVPGDTSGPADYVTDTGTLADAIDETVTELIGYRGHSPGDLKISARTQPEEGWLLCDGRDYDREEYADLFAAIGTTYGYSMSDTFRVPDLRGRMPVGIGTAPGLPGRTIGELGGAAAVTLTTAQMPAHTHTGPSHQHRAPANNITTQPAIVTWAPGGGSGAGMYGLVAAAGAATGVHVGNNGLVQAAGNTATASVGGGNAHDNMPPFAAVNFFIKT